jgi:hypothetical protein
MLTVQCCWRRFGRELGLGALILTLTSGACVAAPTAVVTGVVRDTQGTAQMGAMVEVLASSSARVATVFTDMYGRYRIANLVPGKYQVRATAALFVPALRRNLQLTTGMRATVNLTLSMLSDPVGWLPAERRKADEPGDDWTWTLRSVANRPILRMLDDGTVVLVQPGSKEASHRVATEALVAMTGGNGGFGRAGFESVIALDRVTSEGSDLVFRAALGKLSTAGGDQAPAELDAGYKRNLGFGGSSRMVIGYASRPEVKTGGAFTGMQVLRMANTERMQLGSSVDVEAGGTVYAIHTVGDALTTQPFLRVTVHPGEVWAIRYRLATSRDLQGFDGLDSIAADLPVSGISGGRICTEKGSHQEILLTHKAGAGVIEAAVYHDSISHSAIAGTGAMSAADFISSGSPVELDTATGSFRFLGPGYRDNGLRLTLSEPLTGNLWAALEIESGAGLSTGNAGAEQLSEVSAGLHAEASGAVTASVKGRVLRTGTKLRTAYRWQPKHLVTAVDPYASFSDQGYLSFYVRQALRWGDRLPPGLEATVDVTNLLAEGYRPFLSADGRTLFLAQAPRTVQGGLSFTF